MKIGSTNVNNLKLGDTQISKVYIGEDLIWQNVNPDFIFTIDTRNTSTGSTLSNQFKLPLHSSSTVNATVYWGDGTSDVINVYNQAETTHTYSTEGEYIITISGVINGWQFNNTGDRLKILDIMNWGTFTININSGFYACTNLTCSATDAPTIITSTLLNYFRLCRNFNGAIGNWDVSGVTSISSIFNNASAFNQPLNNWDVSNVISFSNVFAFATNFNQDISDWDVSNATTLSSFMAGKTSANYNASYLDAIYNKWSLLSVNPNLTPNFGSIKYTSAGVAGKAVLTSAPNNWTITDGGLV